MENVLESKLIETAIFELDRDTRDAIYDAEREKKVAEAISNMRQWNG